MLVITVIVMISTVTGKSNITQSPDTESAEPTNHTFNTFSTPDKYSDICYEVGKCGSRGMSCAFDPKHRIANFSVKSAAACKMYCWFHKRCFSFAFHPQALNCSLNSGFPTIRSPSSGEFKSPPYVIGDTFCLKNYEKSPSVPCRTVENVIKTSRNSEGVLIKDVVSRLCLGFGTLMDLKWKDCTLSILWQFEKNSHETRRYASVKILQADSMNHCVETTSKVGDSRIISIVPCEDGNEDQLFQITSGTLYDFSYMKDHNGNDNACFFSIRAGNGKSIYPESLPPVNLAALRVLKPEEHLALCKRNMFKTAHGKVLGDVPFFLPGEKVPVTCIPGYGFKSSKNQSTVNVTCRNEKSRAEKCVKLEEKRTVVLSERESPVLTLSLCANIGQVILAIFLIACVLVLMSKLRAVKAGRGFVKEDKTVPKMNPGL